MRRIILVVALTAFALAGCRQNESEPAATARSDSAEATAAPVQPAEKISPELIDRIIGPFNKGVALMDQYRPVEAVEAFEEVARVASDWIPGRLNLGIALLNSQSDEGYARAEEELKWVINKVPDDPYAHYALGMLLRHLTRFDEAQTQFEAVLTIDPEDADAHYQLGILIMDRDPVAARQHLEKTLQKIPHHESACYRLATLLRKTGEKAKARDMLLRFQALKTSGAGVFSGMKYGEMGRYAAVLRAFGEQVSGPPQAAPEFNETGAATASFTPARGAAGWPGEDRPQTAAAYGPGIAAANVFGNGTMAIYITGAGPDGDGTLYQAAGGSLTAVPNTGIDGRDAVGAWFGDYDGDGDPDLYLTCVGPNRLYRNEGGGRFLDVTSGTGTGGGAFVSVGAAWADADHDGDLDLYVANVAAVGADNRGAPNALWRNNGDGTFFDMAPEAGVDGGTAATFGVLYFDFDDDRDLDLYLINYDTANRLFLNDRVGHYTDAAARFPNLADAGPGLGALVGDLDGNGRQDVLLLRGPQPPRLFLQAGRGRYIEDAAFAAVARDVGGAAGGLISDVDLDGDFDVVLLSAGAGEEFAHRILLSRGAGSFTAPALLGSVHPAPNARGAVALDIDGDGSLELLVARVGDRPQLWQADAPEDRHWLAVIPAKSEEEALLTAPGADGLLVEVKAGRRLQVASVTASAGYLGAPPRRVHFGLGRSATADYVRLSWADAVLQSELEVAADQSWRVTKMTRKPSSCPILFCWDGERFAFVTDFLGGGGIGFFTAPGEYAPPDPTEDIRIPPALIAVRDGRYLLRVTEPLEEITYFDELHLVAYDHPDDRELYPDERLTGTPPFPTGQPFAVSAKIFPETARNARGEDVLDHIREIDRRYTAPPADPRFVGYAADHWIELDFGERLALPPSAAGAPSPRLVLYLYGWVEYTYSHVNYAAYQAGLTMRPPSIEVPDGDGGWRPAVADMGFPAGLPRMMTIDISQLPIAADGRLRIRTNMEVFWDQIFAGVDVGDPGIRVHRLRPDVAELRHLGYPREYSPDGNDPTVYDYHRIDHGVPFKNMAGSFTRFGDVRELLKAADDQFVIMARGEEIAIEFDAGQLPGLEDGWSRTFVLHADGYCKDMDLYTAFPDSVGPLPFHGMDNYPPVKEPRNVEELRNYRHTWNTRKIAGR